MLRLLRYAMLLPRIWPHRAVATVAVTATARVVARAEAAAMTADADATKKTLR